jgi:hypothetical protein
MFGGIHQRVEVPMDEEDFDLEVDNRKYQSGFREWPERNGAKVVKSYHLDDDLFEEIENRELEVRVR